MNKLALALLLAATSALVGCGSSDDSSSSSTQSVTAQEIAAYSASDATKSGTGIVRWTLSHYDANADHGLLTGYDAAGKTVATVEATRHEDGYLKTHVTLGSEEADLEMKNGSATTNTLTAKMPDLAKLASADLDAYVASGGKAYSRWGCVSAVAWTVGGALLSIPACTPNPAILITCTGTVLAGPVAGGASLIDQCF